MSNPNGWKDEMDDYWADPARSMKKMDDDIVAMFRKTKTFMTIVTVIVVSFFILLGVTVIGVLTLAYRAWF